MRKLFLFSICILVSTSAAFGEVFATSAKQVGEYFGVLVPTSARCSTERLIVMITVKADNTLWGEVVDWDNRPIFYFEAEWPAFKRGAFKSSVVPTLENSARGTFSAANGSVGGTVDLRPDGGCLYSFKAYRRHRYN